MTDAASEGWQDAVWRDLKMNNLGEVLARQELDPAVGIKVARLSGDEAFSLFGAEIAAGTKLSAHYHREGIEIYYVLGGTGRMSLGDRMDDSRVVWQEGFEVRAGDCFTVRAGQVHQLQNTGTTVMNALFACPASHLNTDRTIIGGPR
jgi:mannose-6-phosphate isomerase-like protein (cupin superfamily)